MGRRTLRKIDPSLDLTGYLIEFDDLPNPWSTAQLFGRDAPLEVEVGSGKGLFLTNACRDHPERNFLGIEVSRKYARFAAARLAQQQFSHGKVLHGDALQFMAERLPDAAACAVHAYFPDPWWKARHKRRRVMKPSFLRDVQRVLVPGGSLHFWTDVEEYFHSTLDLIGKHTSLAGPIAVPERDPEHDLDYRTHFERRMRKHGEPVYRSQFDKSP